MRLIDADALIEMCIENLDDGDVFYRIPPDYVDDMPTIDAVEVVRCKDCDFSRPIYQENGGVFERTLHCVHGRGYQQNIFGREYSIISPNSFCAAGSRKTDAEVEG